MPPSYNDISSILGKVKVESGVAVKKRKPATDDANQAKKRVKRPATDPKPAKQPAIKNGRNIVSILEQAKHIDGVEDRIKQLQATAGVGGINSYQTYVQKAAAFNIVVLSENKGFGEQKGGGVVSAKTHLQTLKAMAVNLALDPEGDKTDLLNRINTVVAMAKIEKATKYPPLPNSTETYPGSIERQPVDTACVQVPMCL